MRQELRVFILLNHAGLVSYPETENAYPLAEEYRLTMKVSILLVLLVLGFAACSSPTPSPSPFEKFFWAMASDLGHKRDGDFPVAKGIVGGALMDEYEVEVSMLRLYLVDPKVQFPHCLPVLNTFNAIGWLLYSETPQEAGEMLFEASDALDLLIDETDRVGKGAIGQWTPDESLHKCAEIYDGFLWPDEQ